MAQETFLEEAVWGLGKARCDVSGGEGVRLERARKRFYLPDCREEAFSEIGLPVLGLSRKLDHKKEAVEKPPP